MKSVVLYKLFISVLSVTDFKRKFLKSSYVQLNGYIFISMNEMKIHITGEVGTEVTPDEISKQLSKLKPDDTVRVIINSEGGSVFDGFDIYSQLKAIDNKVITEVRGLAASVASLIMLAGDTIEMSQAALVMIHKSSTMVFGNSNEIEDQKKILESIDSVMIDIYSSRTGMSNEEVDELLSEETWLTADEAVNVGLADNIIHVAELKYAAKLMLNQNKKKMALADLFKSFRGTEDEEETPNEAVSEETTQELPEAITREEFDALKEAMEKVAETLDSLMVEGEEEDSEDEEEVPDEEEAKAQEAAIEEIVETKMKVMVKNLKHSNGKPKKGNNSLTGQPSGYVDKYAGFRLKLDEIESNTRNI